jgi:hypothetical protein
MKLPRACNAPPGVRRAARQSFSKNMARHLVWESLRALASGRVRQAARSMATACRLFPLEVVSVAVNGKNARALFVNCLNRYATVEAPAYFRKERAGRSE